VALRRRATWAGLAIALVAALSCGGAAWGLGRPPAADLVVPGATDVRVSHIGLLTQQITYQTPGGQPYGWYFTITRSLALSGWSSPVQNQRGIRGTPETHWRIWQLWIVYIDEEISLQGEADRAWITVRRSVIIPWRRLLR
jgi:hypothetical protein